MLTQQPVQLIASPDGEDGSLDLQQGYGFPISCFLPVNP